jgi:hypothetical protein
MAAGLGFKTFTTGEVLTAADVNGYLMQGVLVFASEAARNSAITSPQEGQFAYTKDNNSLWYYTGSAWAASGATGDIEGVTAGTGISGGGTSGTVTITNSMATEITAKADLIVGTGNATFDNLAVGANATVLTADSAVSPTGLKWAAPASWTLDSTTTLSGASTSINLSAGYKAFHIYCVNYQFTNDAYGYIRFNSNTGSVYRWYGLSLTGTTANAAFYANNDTAYFLSNAQPAESGNQNNHFYMQLYNMDSTTAYKQFLISDMSLSNGAEKRIANSGGFFLSTTAISSIQIFTNDTWSGGTVLVYGVK